MLAGRNARRGFVFDGERGNRGIPVRGQFTPQGQLPLGGQGRVDGGPVIEGLLPFGLGASAALDRGEEMDLRFFGNEEELLGIPTKRRLGEFDLIHAERGAVRLAGASLCGAPNPMVV